MPNPLHPVVVHFPVVLVLLGTVGAVAAVFWRKHQVPALAALLLTLGALGAWAAVETGESDGGLLEGDSTQLQSLVESHENWAKRTLTTAGVAAAAAVASLLLFRVPHLARWVAAGAAVVALLASYSVYETGHRGGQLVFHYGAGVSAVSGPTSSLSEGAQGGRMSAVQKLPINRSE
jgi:uncharacterized membrane protein